MVDGGRFEDQGKSIARIESGAVGLVPITTILGLDKGCL